MAITECGKGHIYDTEQYNECPYCNSNRSVLNFDENYLNSNGNKTIFPEAMDNSNKTVAPEGFLKQKREENKTVGIFKKAYNIEPVVGWLVCIEGPDKGKDYHLWARINTIGRSENMDVCIKGDSTISKENHARLAYDIKHNNYQLIPADSTNNIYVNDEPVYIPVKLNAYDEIEFGNSKMLFIPLCGDKFKWSNVLERKE